MKRILIALLFSLFATSAFATCAGTPGPIVVKDVNGATWSLSLSQNTDGNCEYNIHVDNGVSAGSQASPSAQVLSTQGTPAIGTGYFQAVTVGSSSALALAAASAKYSITLINPNATNGATVACAFGAPAVLNGAGSITLPPGSFYATGNFVPQDAINCIASVASTAFTIGAK